IALFFIIYGYNPLFLRLFIGNFLFRKRATFLLSSSVTTLSVALNRKFFRGFWLELAGYGNYESESEKRRQSLA
ncbi:MAG TPA: hypothetical protein VJN01_04425, partial [Xanthomonadales bacterium]|nr:hypothetical protein [Xanthomonadales bacterium]